MNKKRGKILFLIPGFFYIEEYQKRLYYNDIPLGTIQISSYLRNFGQKETQLIDLRVESEHDPNLSGNIIPLEDFESSLLSVLERDNIQEYEYVGINCYTSFQYLQTNLIGKLLKKHFPGIKLIVGGYHPSAVPEDFTYEDSPFDFVIRGEAELLLLNLLNSPLSKKKKDKKPSQILFAQELLDVNSLPFPDYELYLNKYPYKDKFKFEFYMSRGCPHQCAFCAKNYPFRSYNYKTFEEHFHKLCVIVEEINPKLPKIGFADQCFDKVLIHEKALDSIIQNELQESFQFSCQCRLESFANNLALIDKYKKSNMVIGFGFESANEFLLKEMHKTVQPKKYIETMRHILNKYKENNAIHCRLNVLCGFPGEDPDKFNDTVEFVEKYSLHENIQISPTLFSNYPNVFVYENMKYYEQTHGSLFIKSWWKKEENPMKTSIPEKSSTNYSKKQLLIDYTEKYGPLLKVFKLQPPWDLIVWKKFYDKWLKEISLIN